MRKEHARDEEEYDSEELGAKALLAEWTGSEVGATAVAEVRRRGSSGGVAPTWHGEVVDAA